MIDVETRIGLLYPDSSAEDDYIDFCKVLEPRVAIEVVTTTVGEDAHRVDALLDIGRPDRLLAGADALANRGIRAAAWACTSGSFVYGLEGARRQVANIEAALSVPVTSTSLAFLAALAALGLRRVAVAATYPDEVTAVFVDFLAEGGIQAVQVSSQQIMTGRAVGALSHDDVFRLAEQNDHPSADAILIPDTALHTLALLDELDAISGKPVLTANQVTLWQTLRLADWNSPHPNLGALPASVASSWVEKAAPSSTRRS